MTPYNYSEIKDTKWYFEKYNPQILALADADHDGYITFTEFFFFLTIYQISSELIKKEFDRLGGKMNKDQFSTTLTNIRKKTIMGMKQTNKGAIDARMISASEEEFLHTNQKICENVFQNADTINFDTFLNIKKQIQIAFLHYEFCQFDIEEGQNPEDISISAEDLAKSLLVCLPWNKMQFYTKRAHQCEIQGRVTFNEYVAFQLLIENLDEIK